MLDAMSGLNGAPTRAEIIEEINKRKLYENT